MVTYIVLEEPLGNLVFTGQGSLEMVDDLDSEDVGPTRRVDSKFWAAGSS